MITQVRVPDSVMHTKVEDLVVLLDIVSGKYFGLNETGQEIWTLLLRHAGVVARVIDELKEHVDGDELEPSVRSFIGELVDRGLLVEVAGS
jgi:hypothetical protein